MAAVNVISSIARSNDLVKSTLQALLDSVPVDSTKLLRCDVEPFGQDNYLLTVAYSG